MSFSSNIFIENNVNFAVINKPAGIAVQSGTKSRRNLLDILRATKEFKETSNEVSLSCGEEGMGNCGMRLNVKFPKYLNYENEILTLKKKLEEVRAILESSKDTFPFRVVSQALDLPELQGEPEYVAKEKCKLARKEVEGLVLVI